MINKVVNLIPSVSLLCSAVTVALPALLSSASGGELSGTFTVTESWSVTLTYSRFGPKQFTGTKEYHGTKTGTIVIKDGQYELINASGISWKGASSSLTRRSIAQWGTTYDIYGDYAFAPAYGASAYGLVLVGCFGVKVPLIDGEVPVFYDYDEYSASGSSLAQLHGSGSMIGEKLTARVSSTISLQPGGAGGSASSPITVTASGSGTVSPDYDGKSLQVGKTYTITAKPGKDQVFAGWSGSIVTNTPTLIFVMQPGISLLASFVPSPFLEVKGTYDGIFHDPALVTPQSSGAFTLTVTAGGAFTGNVQMNGKRYTLSGQFDTTGKAAKTVPRPGLSSLTVAMQLALNSGNKEMTGTIGDSTWTVPLHVACSEFDTKANPAPQVGQYTFVIRGDHSSPAQPWGDGFATLTVEKSGGTRLSGSLADGTKLTQAGILHKLGGLPLYLSLYNGQGCLVSWLTVNDTPSENVSGAAAWIKPPNPTAKLYPAGFANRLTVTGSRYTAPAAGNNLLNLPSAELALIGSSLAQNITNQITLGPKNQVKNLSPNKLTLTFTPSTGLFKGSVVNPATSKPISFTGVALQKQNIARGCFLDNNQSGQVLLVGD